MSVAARAVPRKKPSKAETSKTLARPSRAPRNAEAAKTRPDPKWLLAWYDRHRRVLPWRARRGTKPDPYAVWLSEIMLQQTNVTTVAPYYARFLARWPTVTALARAPLDDVLKLWAGLGYYARARNLHACANVIAEQHHGRFPDDEASLRALPGIGTYTAAAIASIAFDRPAVPVDGNVERVVTRLFAIEQQLPAAKPQIQTLATSMAPARRHGDFAQALMDLGAIICTPKRPACALCPWNDVCAAFKRADPENFPRKTPKREGKLRRGAAFVVIREDGALLVRSRAAKGLLGGMTEVPTTEWTADFDAASALSVTPVSAKWRKIPTQVNHVFTHFPLQLSVYVARVPKRTRPPQGARFLSAGEIASAAFPSIMRKVLASAGIDP
jgi:A/G-specific adenine glycosylase